MGKFGVAVLLPGRKMRAVAAEHGLNFGHLRKVEFVAFSFGLR
jgi:hypothetical protein